MSALLARVAKERMSGSKPSAPRAMGAALAAGTTVAALTYRVLRR
jgi:hypothetical protein